MHDIRLAIGLIAFLSVGLFLLTLRLLRGRPLWVKDVTALVTVLSLVVYVRFVWGQLWIVQWIPLPSVIVLSNWFPPLLAILAAATWLRLAPALTAEGEAPEWTSSEWRMAFLRRLPVMTALVVSAVYSVLHFIPQQPPECAFDWARPIPPMQVPVCIQTTNKTCSAAAAATLLVSLGYEATEQEMAELCLTKSGTTWLGLYHGLSTKLFRTGYRVEFFEGDLSSLPLLLGGRPVLLCCQLDPAVADEVPIYVTKGGWVPGVAHTVVYFGRFQNQHVIGDPSVGYEVWGDQDLQVLWTGEGLKITGDPYEQESGP